MAKVCIIASNPKIKDIISQLIEDCTGFDIDIVSENEEHQSDVILKIEDEMLSDNILMKLLEQAPLYEDILIDWMLEPIWLDNIFSQEQKAQPKEKHISKGYGRIIFIGSRAPPEHKHNT